MSQEHQKILADMLGGKITGYNAKLAKITGSVNSAVFLHQLLYWTGKERDDDGWIMKTVDNFEEETGLSDKQQLYAQKILITLGVLEYKLSGMPQKRHFRIDIERLYDLVEYYHRLGRVTPKGGTESANGSMLPVEDEVNA